MSFRRGDLICLLPYLPYLFLNSSQLPSLFKLILSFYQQQSFIKIPVISERFSSATSLQYYHQLPSLDRFVSYIRKHACHDQDSSCHNEISTVHSAKYIDIDFDAISQILSMNVYWDGSFRPHGWTEVLQKSRRQDKIEVGVLEAEKAIEPEHLALSGFLTVVGEDDKPGMAVPI